MIHLSEREFFNKKMVDITNEILSFVTVSDKNIFISGSAGTGKSFLLRNIYEKLSESYMVKIVAITGMSSINVEGETISSFFNIPPHDIEKIKIEKIKISNNLKLLDVLIIDEISLVSKEVFELINKIAQKARHSKEIFGGIRIIVFGDFFQNPPYSNSDDILYCFESSIWTKCNFKYFNLTKNYRQSELDFFDTLNRIRTNNLIKKDIDLLNSLTNNNINQTDDKYQDWITIYASNAEKDYHNMHKLRLIDEKEFEFKSEVKINIQNAKVENFKKNSFKTIPENLIIKKNSKIMIIKNLKEIDLYNGDTGYVVSISDNFIEVFIERKNKNYIIKKTSWCLYSPDNYILCEITQFPISLSWAITITKSQGLSFEKLIIDCTNINTFSVFYTAISRSKNKDFLILKNFSIDKIVTDQKVVNFYRKLIN